MSEMVEVSEHDLCTLLEWGLMAEKDGVISRNIWLKVYLAINKENRFIHRELPYWVEPAIAQIEKKESN